MQAPGLMAGILGQCAATSHTNRDEARSAGGGDLLQDLAQLRPATRLPLREDEIAVERDVELTAGTLGQRGINAASLLDLGCQTGSPGEIVSLNAVGDLELHGFLLGAGVRGTPDVRTIGWECRGLQP
jgi:hypothetical protein